MWDFGTIKAIDAQNIIDRRNSSYAYSDSSDESDGGAETGTSRLVDHDIYQTIKQDNSGKSYPGTTHPSWREGQQGDWNNDYSQSFTVRSNHESHLGITTSKAAIYRDQSTTKGNVKVEVSQPESLVLHNAIVPVLEQLRSQAAGYPVALKSIEKLRRCLFEVETETSGLVDTFVMYLERETKKIHKET